MEQVTVISDEKLNGIIDDYMETHSKELVVFVQQQIDKAVKSKIRELFQDTNGGYGRCRDEGEARKNIGDRLSVIISKYVDKIEIDKEDIQTMVDKKVQAHLKALKVNVSIKR